MFLVPVRAASALVNRILSLTGCGMMYPSNRVTTNCTLAATVMDKLKSLAAWDIETKKSYVLALNAPVTQSETPASNMLSRVYWRCEVPSWRYSYKTHCKSNTLAEVRMTQILLPHSLNSKLNCVHIFMNNRPTVSLRSRCMEKPYEVWKKISLSFSIINKSSRLILPSCFAQHVLLSASMHNTTLAFRLIPTRT